MDRKFRKLRGTWPLPLVCYVHVCRTNFWDLVFLLLFFICPFLFVVVVVKVCIYYATAHFQYMFNTCSIHFNTRSTSSRLQRTVFGWPRMASTTLRLQITVFDDFRMASTTLSDYGLHMYDFNFFRAARGFFLKNSIWKTRYMLNYIETFSALRAAFSFRNP